MSSLGKSGSKKRMAMNILSCEYPQIKSLGRILIGSGRLSPAMALKHGYTNVEDYKNGVQKKFSLLELGILKKPSTRLLLINVSISSLSYIRWNLTRYREPMMD
jgi:hypothetical protein